jgi:hypothetical protein
LARAPDTDLFERLYRACYADLLRYALRRTGRPETAAGRCPGVPGPGPGTRIPRPRGAAAGPG